jgi:hypothetical protein
MNILKVFFLSLIATMDNLPSLCSYLLLKPFRSGVFGAYALKISEEGGIHGTFDHSKDVTIDHFCNIKGIFPNGTVATRRGDSSLTLSLLWQKFFGNGIIFHHFLPAILPQMTCLSHGYH